MSADVTTPCPPLPWNLTSTRIRIPPLTPAAIVEVLLINFAPCLIYILAMEYIKNKNDNG
jgi:hypothetical protein